MQQAMKDSRDAKEHLFQVSNSTVPQLLEKRKVLQCIEMYVDEGLDILGRMHEYGHPIALDYFLSCATSRQQGT